MLDSIDFAPLRRPEPARPLGFFPTAAKRRSFTPEEKARLVAESFASRDSVCAFARRHHLSASQLFAWRKIARQGAGATLPAALPAPGRHGSESEAEVVSNSPESDAGSDVFDSRIFATEADGRLAGTWLEALEPETPRRLAARIEIAIGSAVVRVPNGIDRATLKLVLDALRET
jgi:transposase